MRSVLLSTVFVIGLASLAPLQSAYADDASDARSAISGQLDAFKAADGAGAYGYAAPNIRQIFPNPDIFMTMVERGYPPVYQSSNVTFGAMKPEGAGLRQEVFLSDKAGQSWIASYTLERQPDGTLKISGCQIRKGNDVGA
ncbi:DUF4864 domain-containing protein [Aureimonas sp. AU12]|uniref:DUF4864 domain-containing protein n=1 Tax=Aureimonas sp. AU12 TaxID=1638161 RepID=UPI0009EA12E2|nr:DUF4864 domain-containing protein [Aureimonas sp. AU12]